MEGLDFTAIGKRIRKQREFLGYTREYMAERLSVSSNFCRDIEVGAKGMSIQTLAKVSIFLKISLDYMVFGETLYSAYEPLLMMLNACKADKRKYAEDILKSFLLALE